MKHIIDDLLAVVYQHYPRGIESDGPRWQQSPEYARLVAARKKAASDPRWPALLRRISARHDVTNESLHLPTGELDACYSFSVDMPEEQHRALWFHASFLSPYQIAYVRRRVEDAARTAARRAPVEEVTVEVHGVCFALPRSALGAALLAEIDEEQKRAAPVERDELLFTLPPGERAIADWIGHEVEATFGCAPLPPEIGATPVPDVATNMRRLGEATLLDCLFCDDRRWVSAQRPLPPAVAQIDASRMPAWFFPTATVLGAASVIWALAQKQAAGGVYAVVETDGTLDKDRLLDLLAGAEAADLPAPRDLLLATRDLRAAVTAWDGRGAPSDAAVAGALKVLALAAQDESQARRRPGR
jgi:hypothetical protein